MARLPSIVRPSGISPYPSGQNKVQPFDPRRLPPQREFIPRAHFFFGRRGDGKTLSMTWLGQVMKERYRLYSPHFKIRSNYWVEYADESDPYLLDELLEFPPWAWYSLILADEIATAFSNLRVVAGRNLAFANLLRQMRKRGLEWYFTTQFPTEVDRTVLMQVDIFVQTEPIRIGGELKGIHLLYYDYWGQYTGRYYRRPWPPQYGEHDWEKVISPASAMFGKYRSNEVVAPMFSAAREEIVKQQWDIPESVDDEVLNHVGRPDPEDLEEMFAQAPDEFSVGAFVARAQFFDKSLNNVPKLRKWLTGHGYVIENLDGLYIAKKEEALAS